VPGKRNFYTLWKGLWIDKIPWETSLTISRKTKNRHTLPIAVDPSAIPTTLRAEVGGSPVWGQRGQHSVKHHLKNKTKQNKTKGMLYNLAIPLSDTYSITFPE
jgi:hypothetical protein